MLQAEFALEGRPDRMGPRVAHAPPDSGECRARASIYRLLAGVFAEEPGGPFLSSLREPALLAQLAQAGVSFEVDFLAPDLDALQDALACEYATLFAASGGFPPVESVRLMGRYMQDPAFKTAATYRRMGFGAAKGRFEMFADHLGVELDFVAALLERRAVAIDAGDEAAQHALDKEVRRFWTLHLGRWVRGYARLISRAAEHSFYRGMAGFLGGFAEEEVAAMGLRRLEDLDEGREVVPKAEIQLEFDPDEPVCGGCADGTEAKRAPQVATVTVHRRLGDLQI